MSAAATRVWVSGDWGGIEPLYGEIASQPGVQVVGCSVTLGEAAADVAAGAVDAVLLALRGSAVPHHDLAALREHSQAPVLGLVTDPSPQLLEEAAGADLADLLPLPQAPEHVAFALRKAHALRRPAGDRARTRVITVFSPKGGTGKSTTATNVSAALAAGGSRTLLVDFDLQFGDAAIMLGLEPRQTLRELVTAPGDLDGDKLAGYVTEHASGIHVLPAPLRPEDAELVTDAHAARLLDAAAERYDAVVVDTAPYFHGPMLAALDRTEQLLLVCVPDVPTLKNLRLALQTLELLSFPADRTRIVLNRASAEVGLRVSDVEAVLGRPVDFELPSDRAVVAGVNRGVPAVLDSPDAPYSEALRGLVGAVTGGRTGAAARPARRFAFGRSGR